MMIEELPVPTSAEDDHEGFEVLRVFYSNHGHHVSPNLERYRNKGFSQAKGWGIILADVARHVSSEIAYQSDEDAYGVEVDLMEAFLKEFENPTN